MMTISSGCSKRQIYTDIIENVLICLLPNSLMRRLTPVYLCNECEATGRNHSQLGERLEVRNKQRSTIQQLRDSLINVISSLFEMDFFFYSWMACLRGKGTFSDEYCEELLWYSMFGIYCHQYFSCNQNIS